MPAIWLPDPAVRHEREQARFRSHLVKHRSMLKHRIHLTLASPTASCSTGPFEIPQPWGSTVDASIALIDYLE